MNLSNISKNIFYLEQYIVEIGRYLAIVKPNQFLGFQDLSDLRNVNNCLKFEINMTVILFHSIIQSTFFIIFNILLLMMKIEIDSLVIDIMSKPLGDARGKDQNLLLDF